MSNTETNRVMPEGTIVSLAVDPGLANTGIAAVERFPDGSYRSRGLKVSVTAPSRDKSFKLRASADEQRRLREHWQAVTQAITVLKPHVIGVENYSLFEPRDIGTLRQSAQDVVGFFGNAFSALDPRQLQEMLQVPEVAERLLPLLYQLSDAVAKNVNNGFGMGQAAKTIAVYGGVLGAAFAAGVPVLVFEPGDRTKKIGGRRGASKEEVGAAVLARVHGLQAHLEEKVPQKGRREHALDAVALAILAAEEYVQQRLDQGLVVAAG